MLEKILETAFQAGAVGAICIFTIWRVGGTLEKLVDAVYTMGRRQEMIVGKLDVLIEQHRKEG